jgi:hypothetical protein
LAYLSFKETACLSHVNLPILEGDAISTQHFWRQIILDGLQEPEDISLFTKVPDMDNPLSNNIYSAHILTKTSDLLSCPDPFCFVILHSVLQIDEMATASQLKLLTDNFFTEHNEDGALSAGAYKPCFWFCHVNNMLVIRH